MSKTEEVAVYGGGCFWCLDAQFRLVKGITKVVSGYAGGDDDMPEYRRHGSHAEVVELTFDPRIISFETLLEMFWFMHDPTTLNRQDFDVGTAYRSIILATTDEQLKIAKQSMQAAQADYKDPIVTEIKLLDKFYEAEEYHQNFYNTNPNVGYCSVITAPKVKRFKEKFADLLM